MAKVLERIDGEEFEIKLPHLFSKMKVSIDGREVAVGVKKKNVHTASFAYEGTEIVVTLKETLFPAGFEFAISKNGSVQVSKAITQAGKEVDAQLLGIPKWMFVFPVLAGAPILLHGLIPAGLGAAGAAIGYKLVASFKDNRPKLVLFGIANIAATWTLIFFLVGGFYQVLLQMGMLKHSEDYLKSTVEKTNAQLPIHVDQITTLQHASYDVDTLTLRYAVGPLDLSTFDQGAFLASMKGLLTTNTCQEKDMRLLLKNEYWVRYEYFSGTEPLGSILVSGKDCKW